MTAMDISRDSCYLLTCSLDGDVRLWSLKERACVVVAVFFSSLVCLLLFSMSLVEYSVQSPKLPVRLWRIGCACVSVFHGRSVSVASGVISA